MKIKIETKDVNDLADGIAHDVRLFLINREIEEEDARRIAKTIGDDVSITIWSGLGIT